MWIYCKYITKNGIKIYPKNASCFCFWVEDDDRKDNASTNNQAAQDTQGKKSA